MNSIKSIISICVMVAIAQLGLAHINPNLAPKSNGGNDNSDFNTSLREDCLEAINTTNLNINNVRALLQVGGDVWWDLDNGSYVVPKQASREDEVSAIFSGSVWVGGLTPSGSIKLAAGPNGAYYGRQGAVDWYSGPLDVEGITDKPICDDWNTFFKVDGESVRNAVRLFDKDPLAFACDSIQNDVKYWPGKNNPFWGEEYDFELPVDQSLGAFWDEPGVDGNGDGVYNPCDGDFPIINIRNCEPFDRKAAFELIPDEMTFWIYNDNGGAHRISFATPIQMEVQVQAFAYATNDAINDMTFNRYKLINKASEDIRETYFALWVDPDLGCYQDDYIGCDVDRSLAYVYNEDAVDGIEGGETCGGVNTYGTNVPILGIDYFRGPRGPKIFCRDMDGNILTQIDEETGDTVNLFCDPPIGSGDFDTLLEIGMSAFMYMNNCGVGNPPVATCDAGQSTEFYNIMKGIWLDGTPVTVGGDGYNPGSTDSTSYVFPDEPNDESTDAWSMCTADLPFGDRRVLQVTGPLLLQPQATNELIVGVVFVPDEESYPCPDLSRLLSADDLAQSLFDNCFNITDGPDAPDVCGIELDQEIIMTLFNQEGSNNFKELYEEKDLLISDESVMGDDELYKFEGYKIYQLVNGGISPSELDNIDKARLVFQTDLKNEVSELWNWTSQISPISSSIIYSPTRKVVGANIGMKNTLSITEDQFATGADPRLVNHKTYYYMSLAYGFNEYAKFEEDTGTGQPRPYIEGRGNIKTYAYTPRPIVYQELLSNYGDVPSLTRLDGVGSGLTFIDMEDDMYDKILEASVNGNAADGVTYKKNAGPVNVKIYNPLDVKEGTFRLELFGTELDENNSTNFLGGDARWRLTNIGDGDVIESDTTIDVSAEQIVEKYGFSIELNQIAEPGELREVNNGAVGSTLEYDDVNGSIWMTAIPDGGLGNGDRLFDWVANTVAQDPENDLKEVSDVFYPFSMARYAPPSELEPSFYVTPAWKQGQGFLIDPVIQFGDLLLNQDLNNVDIIMTSDKEKWSRCIVVETASPDYYNTAGLQTQGNRNQFDIRAGASVGKDGEPDGSGEGMGWFPGYAVDVETGERLNIFFGENSVYDEDVSEYLTGGSTGGDMIFNPTSQTISADAPPDQPQFGIFNLVGGGQHFIYVTRQRYDECALLANDLQPSNNPTTKFNPLSLVTWAAFPTNAVGDGNNLLSVADGIIPNELKFKLRVTNPFGFATEIDEEGTSSNNKYDGAKIGGYPAFEFKIEGAASRALAANEYEGALENVNVVPNPYYAYSAYERSEFDNTIKITNLPPRADITIYSLDGKFIRTFLRDEQDMIKSSSFPVQTQQGFPDVSWDLKNDKGVPVASGVYLIHVRAEFDDGSMEERVIKWFGVGRKFDPSNL